MNDFAFVIKTFQRPLLLKRLMHSIRRFYPDHKVYIADDSIKPYSHQYAVGNTVVLPMDYDSGLSAGRNLLFESAEEPYLFLCDDDFIVNADTKADDACETAIRNNLDILGISVGGRHFGKDSFTTRIFRQKPGRMAIVSVRGMEQLEPGVIMAEFVQNAGIFKRDAVLAMDGWDPYLKVYEHADFFYRAKLAGLRVAESSKHNILHRQRRSRGYRKMRHRTGFLRHYVKKYGQRLNYEAGKGVESLHAQAYEDVQAKTATRLYHRYKGNGRGSTVGRTKQLRQALPELLSVLGVSKVLDAPCGNQEWMSKVPLPSSIDYTGYDVMAGVIETNAVTYPDKTFKTVDLLKGEVEGEFDLIICRNFFNHVPLRHSTAILDKFRRTGARYLIANSVDGPMSNEDLTEQQESAGWGWRALRLEDAPFSLKPLDWSVREPGIAANRYMALYEL